MITTNLPQLVQELNAFGPVTVHDRLDTIELELHASFPMHELDDLICDAIFIDPLARHIKGDRCMVSLAKRSDLRGASDLDLVCGLSSTVYVLKNAA